MEKCYGDMLRPVPKPQKIIKQKKGLKKKQSSIPKSVLDEVDSRDNLICQGCGRPVTREQKPYHHITFRSGYGLMVRFWVGLIWKMVTTWFKKHSKENLVTLCLECHEKPHRSKEMRWFWEKWRDEKYGKKEGWD